jgi:hypothetical protein
MYVFHDQSETTGKYHGRPMNVLEREKLMGYPDGYVEKPGQSGVDCQSLFAFLVGAVISNTVCAL